MTSACEQLLRISLCGVAVTGGVLCSNSTVSAQIPPPGYIFVDVRDESDKPVANVTGIVYNAAGAEVGSAVTDQRGEAALIQNREAGSDWIFRIIKSGYVIYEDIIKTTGQYSNVRVAVKLVRRARSQLVTPQGTAPPAKARASPRGLAPP